MLDVNLPVSNNRISAEIKINPDCLLVLHISRQEL